MNRLLKAISIIVIIYFIVATIILYGLDPSFPTIFDSAWYLLETLTSVGYGDIIPVTIPGRVMGVLTIVMGVFFISIFTAAISALYVEVPEKETRKEIKDHVDVLEQQNEELKRKVDNLNEDIVSLHEKIDKLTLLIDRDDDDET